MQYINSIIETTNPLMIVAPIILMILSGYAVGRIISRIRKIESGVLMDLTSGSVILNFLFIFGFIIFGLITSVAKAYFLYFTYGLVILSIISIFFLIKLQFNRHNAIVNNFAFRSSAILLFGIALVVTLVVYNAMVIYYHPIFLEYDPVNNYLLTSKSILLGNGLNHDYYGGTDIRVSSPPMINAVNAWIIDIFGYSSLRLFPIYFIIISSLYIYRFSKKVTNDPFLGCIGAAAFLITPAILGSNSRFSLYPDTSFILFLIASFFFLTQITSQKRFAKKDLLMLTISLSTMTLSREVGLILTWSILFVVLYVKFSNGKRIMKFLCSVLALLPFYLLAVNDFRYYGITDYTAMRLIEIALVNAGLCYIFSYLTKEESTVKLSNLIYFIPLLVPAIFLVINIVNIQGPYASIVFSDSLNKSTNSYQTIMGFQNRHSLGLLETLEKIPRLDILFTATALGTIFIFFKLSGFITMIRKFKINADYASILTIFILLLAVWAYLDLGTSPGDLRHISYFAPIFAVVFVLGLRKRTTPYKLIYYGIIVLSTYYFTFHDMLITNFNNHFGGFWIDPYRESTITLISLEWSALLILAIVLIELKESVSISFLGKIKSVLFPNKKYFIPTIVVLFALLSANIYTLSATGIPFDPPEKTDSIPQDGWEVDEMEVIDFLNHSEKGNVLSLQTQAIPFFTNRTSYELFDPHTYASLIPLLKTENSTAFKQKIIDLNIRYFVFPNKDSPLFDKTKRFSQIYNVTNILENDNSFQKTVLKSHTIYKFIK